MSRMNVNLAGVELKNPVIQRPEHLVPERNTVNLWI